MPKYCFSAFLVSILLCSAVTCTGQTGGTLFSLIPSETSGIDFRNDVHEDSAFNVIFFEYIYGGGGVATGDLNNDGLPDIVLTANQTPTKVYLNKGNFHFQDITAASGINNGMGWTTGVTIADVDGDGWLDVYICKSGIIADENRQNRLFINNHNLTFTEKAKEMGLNDGGTSIQAVFFDYDGDGDLDCYILALHSGIYQKIVQTTETDTSQGAKKNTLLENINGHFVDVTAQSQLPFADGNSMGVNITDINGDGYPDIFLGKDDLTSDQIFINTGKKTFIDETEKYLTQCPMYTMGSDVGDLNNDGKPDFVAVDMKGPTHERIKSTLFSMPLDFIANLDTTYKIPQRIKNCIIVSNDTGKYSQISELSNMDRTDMSWSALVQDFDNDGWNDIQITTGTKRDIADLDFSTLQEDAEHSQAFKHDTTNLYKSLPIRKLPNYAFRNMGNLRFENVSAQWGIDLPAASQGAAYADFDGDGAVDMIVNNAEDKAFLYRNTANEKYHRHWVGLKLATNSMNKFALGAKAKVYAGGMLQMKQMDCVHGYQSSSELTLHFGLGDNTKVDSVLIQWPDRKWQKISDISMDKVSVIIEPEAKKSYAVYTPKYDKEQVMRAANIKGLAFKHQESDFNDFKRDRLIPFKFSRQGPGMAVGDVNGDKLDDVFVLNGAGHTAALFMQQSNGSFVESMDQPWKKDSSFEGMGCVFFDLNGDGLKDIYIATGSNEFATGDHLLGDRLYLNDGTGHFINVSHRLPIDHTAHSCVAVADFDHDGDDDLFVGGWLIPGNYPQAGNSHLLQNSKGILTDVTETMAPSLKNCGMVTAAEWADFDHNGYPDLVLAGEWMPITIYHNANGFSNVTRAIGLDSTNGFWKSLAIADVDGDGDLDIIAGNLGENAFLKASNKEPVSLLVNDFDNNGAPDAVMFHYLEGKNAPFCDRNTFCEQMPKYRNKFLTYHSYATSDWSTIFTPEQIDRSQKYYAYRLTSSWFENKGGKFIGHDLPVEAQLAPIFGILPYDFDHDGVMDYLLSGNWFSNYYEGGNFDAFRGTILKGSKGGNLKALSFNKTGYYNDLDAKTVRLLKTKNKQYVLLTNNNGPLRMFQLK